jgi:predicted acetyltransferase
MTAPTARLIEHDELAGWWEVPRVAMHGSPITPEEVEGARAYIHPERCIAAFDGTPGAKPCGSAGSFFSELTVPGGGMVRAGAVTAVGVLPTHRRQGHLSRMMQVQLADIVERGESVAILIAAEYPIYGRYGYGPAIEACGIRLDADPELWRDPPTGTAELLDNDTFTKELVELYDRVRPTVVGHMSYEDARWGVQTGTVSWPDGNNDKRRNAVKVVWRDDEGAVQAAARYSVDDRWVDNRPRGTAEVPWMVAATAEAEREIVRFLTAIDWVTTVRLGLRPVDDPLPLRLRDGRAAFSVDRSDFVWCRPLDLPTTLSARRYAVEGHLVLEVDDPLGFAAGRFALEGGPDGASCTPTTESPDLRVPVTAVGAAYLGGFTWSRLSDAGWVEELTPGAVQRASTLFATPRSPACALGF